MSELLRDFNNALDCCGTCAGGVLNRHVTDRLAAVTARAEAAEAKIARVETLADEGGRSNRHANGYAYVRVIDLRAALADEGDTHE